MCQNHQSKIDFNDIVMFIKVDTLLTFEYDSLILLFGEYYLRDPTMSNNKSQSVKILINHF